MPARCYCGNDNPDGSAYCNRCGRAVSSQSGELRIDELRLYEERPYLKYGNPKSLFMWGGTHYMTKAQYMVRLFIAIPFGLFGVAVFIAAGHPFVALVFLTVFLGGLYLGWHIGRRGVEQKG